MIRHIVFFRIKDANGMTKYRICSQLKEKFAELPSKISVIQKLVSGQDFIHGEMSYDFALEVDFKSVDDLNFYSTHPAHLNVVEWLKPYMISVAAVDFNM